jgi:hypothetical protein
MEAFIKARAVHGASRSASCRRLLRPPTARPGRETDLARLPARAQRTAYCAMTSTAPGARMVACTARGRFGRQLWREGISVTRCTVERLREPADTRRWVDRIVQYVLPAGTVPLSLPSELEMQLEQLAYAPMLVANPTTRASDWLGSVLVGLQAQLTLGKLPVSVSGPNYRPSARSTSGHCPSSIPDLHPGQDLRLKARTRLST